MARMVRCGGETVVAVVDIDRFKQLNDVFGHAAGDEVLVGVARRLISTVRGHDTVARAITLLANADLALKGAIEWPDGLVLEILVARLSRLGGRPATKTGTRAGSSTGVSRSPRRSPRGP